MTSSAKHQSAHARRASRPLLAIVIAVAGATCTDRNSLSPLTPSAPESQATLAGLTISPDNDTALVGQTISLTASGIPGGKQATWRSSDTSIATVAATGAATAAVTGRAVGLVTISVSAGNKSGTASVRVLPVPVRSVTVAPDSATVQLGDSAQFAATPRDSSGAPLGGRAIVWSTLDTTVATVSSNGMAHARARGTARILAVADGVTGQASLIVAVPELAVPTMSVRDSVNAGDTLLVKYWIQNLGDSPIADSVIVRVGLRSTATNTVVRAVRRAMPRVNAIEIRGDSTRLLVPSAPPGTYAVVVYADCRDVGDRTDEMRLGDCLAAPATAGTITESNETNNSNSATVILRGPQLTATTLTAPDTVLTRTSVTAALTVTNSGSGTATGFDVIAGLYDVTTSAVVAAATVSTPILSTRGTRIVSVAIAIPGGIDLAHQYQVWAYADCTNSGATPADRLQACIATPGSAGDIPESNENDNGTKRAAIVLSNVARVNAVPDTIRFATIGDTARLSASAFDLAGAPIAGVTATWTSLDPAASVTTTGLVRSLANGSARIVASIEGRADTTIAIVAQLVTSVVVTPDSALIGVAGAVNLLAEPRDASGVIIGTVRPSWTSLDPAVATVTDSGRVLGIAVGMARVVATANGRADTSVVFVNPAGYTHRWLGVNSLGWEQTANWYPHTVPSRDIDSPFIPAGTPQRPFLVGTALVRSIKVAAGTSLDLRSQILLAFGSVDASGSIDNGTVELRGSGTLGGTLPFVNVRGPTQLAARTSAMLVSVQDSAARLTIYGHTLITSFLGVGTDGSVVESNPLDTIWVTSDAVFNSSIATVLSAGVLRLDGSFSNYGPPGSFAASGSHATIFSGAAQQQLVTFADTTSGFQNVIVLNSQTGVQLQTTMSVKGLMRLVNGGRFSSPQWTLRFLSQLPDISQGVYDVAITSVGGPLALQQNHVFPGTIFIENGASLALNGHTLDVRSLFNANGTLTMSSTADTLIARQDASFLGRETLTAGTLIARGGLSVTFVAGAPGTGFNASGTHTTVFGGSIQSWTIDQPDKHWFANVRVLSGSSVQLNSDVHVRGRLTVDAGATLAQQQSNSIFYHGPLPDASRGTYQVFNTRLAAGLDLAEDVVLPASTTLLLGDSVTLSLNGHKLDVNSFFPIGPLSVFVMPGLTPAESLIVRGNAFLGSVLDLRGGVIAAYGDLTQGSIPLSSGAQTGTKTVFLGQRTHQVSGLAGDSVKFVDVDILDGGTVTTGQHVVLDGLLTLGPRSTLTLGQNNELRVNHVLPAVEQGTLNASSVVVRGEVSMDASRRYTSPLMFRVTGTSRLRLNGHTLDVAGTLAIEGGVPGPAALIMDGPLDSLIVGNQLYVLGAALFSAGTFIAKGDIVQDVGGASLLAGTGTHTTVLAGTTAQRLQLATASNSYFNNLEIDNPAGVDISTNVEIHGQLRGVGAGVVRSTNNYLLNVTGGVDVAGLVFDGTALSVTGVRGTMLRFDNVTFRNAISPALLRIRYDGPGEFFMNNIAFLTAAAPGTYWIDADTIDPAAGPIAFDVSSPQWQQGPANTHAGNATVSWRATSP